MVKSTMPDHKSKDEADQKKREEKRKQEEKEKKEYEQYLQRVRDMIQEDRKTNKEKAQVEIDGMLALQTASLKESLLKPLTGSRERLTDDQNPSEITIKIIHETRKQLHTLPETATVSDFKNILKTHFNIKNPKAFISTIAEIDFKNLGVSLKSIGVSNMDTIYVHSL
ncbi:hypothetical protein NEMIN01_1799 [Nematocida minor]|uniref:uncharacterized protein n=1 Tax=Nematocida minor TaxID=1912983 RepID=UPI00221FFABB|nr:uncharacterized protein NEMIN01_1799 [Nematocida minor]KAI5192051.1 hypothetical protein NEMIN01_1799 [Nematocida minor]